MSDFDQWFTDRHQEPPANEREEVADLFQWFFRLKAIEKIAGQRINARFLASAMQDLSTACFGDNPNEVRLAWQMVLDTLGPVLTGKMIDEGVYRRYTPEPDSVRGTPSLAVVWRKNGQSVVARAQYVQDKATGIRFDVE
jgi:hypothetical protein